MKHAAAASPVPQGLAALVSNVRASPGFWDPSPLASIGLVAVLSVLALSGSAWGRSKEHAARSVYVFLHFTWNLLYTIVILDSKDLCARMGMSAADSGHMVGMSYLGMAVGATGMWLLLRQRPELWRSASRIVLASGTGCQLLTSGVYTYVVMASAGGGGLATLLVASRFVQGVGAGSNMQFYMATSLCLTEVAERPNFSMSVVLGGTAGCGFGLVFSAFLSSAHTAVAQVAAAVASVVALLLVHPCLADLEDRRAASPAGGELEVEEEEAGSRKVLIVGVTLIGCVRKAMWGAMEVAPALLLKDAFRWDRRDAGLATGAALLGTIPARILYSSASSALPPRQWIRLLAVLVIAGLVFCFEATCDLGASVGIPPAGLLMCSLAVCLAFLFLLEGLLVGTMQQHVLPSGPFDGNHSQLWYIMALGTGGFLGPWASRLAIQERGQDAFAGGQIATALAFAAVFEAMVAPRMQSFPAAATKWARQPTP